ncbi:MAG TPA: hypothetical protein DDX75_06150 [Phycisphaerales bacterium]|nr:hypothetical protein [Phycisphaerales bacterium]
MILILGLGLLALRRKKY